MGVLVAVMVIAKPYVWSFLDWLKEISWLDAYVMVGLVVAAVVGICAFFGGWYFIQSRYGFGGVLFGWIPGAVLAITAGPILGAVWPLTVVGGGYLLLTLL